jgi:hypothetical protein
MKVPGTPKQSKQTAKRPNVIVKGSEKYSTFKVTITLIASAIITIHLTICLILTVNPGFKIFNSKLLTKLYTPYALSGPYFSERFIKSSPHFYIAGKRGRVWDEWRDPELENFNTFHQRYWHFDKLKQASLERHIAWKLYGRVLKDSLQNFKTFKEFKGLRNYFESEYFKESPDSIRMLYTQSTYKPRERKTKIDTLFFLKYKPW